MHAALVIDETRSAGGNDALHAALDACGFAVTIGNGWPPPAERARRALIATCLGSSNPPPGYRLWLPGTAGPEHVGLELAGRVGLPDVVAVLLACGYTLANAYECARIFDTLGDLCGHDAGTVTELAETLIASNDEDLEALRRALAQGRRPDVAAAAHRLKSVARMLACPSLAAVCAQLEGRANAPSDTAGAAALAALLVPGFAALDIALRRGPERRDQQAAH